MKYNNYNQFEGWKPYGASEMYLLDNREGEECEFIECKQSKNNNINVDDVLVVDGNKKHALLKFADGINVHFIKEI